MSNKYKFSHSSLNKLDGVHPKLVKVVKKVMGLQVMDFLIAEGLRTPGVQEIYVLTGRSKTMNSKHLIQDDGFAHAVDLYPYPINMQKVNRGEVKEYIRFGILAGLMKAMGKQEGVNIIWGGDWDSDGLTSDTGFFDAPHFQIDLRL